MSTPSSLAFARFTFETLESHAMRKVGRLHCETPEARVARYVLNATHRLTRPERRALYLIAIARHRANRAVYFHVLRGGF